MFRSDLKDKKFFEQLVFWNVIFEWQSIDLIQEEEVNAIQVIARDQVSKRVDIPIVNVITNELHFCQKDDLVVFLVEVVQLCRRQMKMSETHCQGQAA